jgi:hypothetical protein
MHWESAEDTETDVSCTIIFLWWKKNKTKQRLEENSQNNLVKGQSVKHRKQNNQANKNLHCNEEVEHFILFVPFTFYHLLLTIV